MKLAPGSPLVVGLQLDERHDAFPTARLATSAGLAQLEWSQETIAAGRLIDPLLYPLEPGLQAARGRKFAGLHGFFSDSLPDV